MCDLLQAVVWLHTKRRRLCLAHRGYYPGPGGGATVPQPLGPESSHRAGLWLARV